LLRILGRAPDPLPADQVLRVLERGFVVRRARRHVRAAEDQVRRLQQACAAEIDRLYQEEKYEAALEPFTFSREHWQDRRRDITRAVKGRFKEPLQTAEQAAHDAKAALRAVVLSGGSGDSTPCPAASGASKPFAKSDAVRQKERRTRIKH